MSKITADDSIGPELDLADVTLPPAVGDRLGTLLGTRGIDTAADWVAAMRAALADREGRVPTADDLCTAADGEHSFEPAEGGGEAYVCVLDPLVVPFLRETPGTVRSSPPVGGDVTVEVRTGGAAVEPPEAVVSLGVAAEVPANDPGEATPWAVYEQVCPYVHAFDSRASYEAWLAGVDAHATAVPAGTGVALARELARELFGDRGRGTGPSGRAGSG